VNIRAGGDGMYSPEGRCLCRSHAKLLSCRGEGLCLKSQLKLNFLFKIALIFPPGECCNVYH
jgi:hypothetical protein